MFYSKSITELVNGEEGASNPPNLLFSTPLKLSVIDVTAAVDTLQIVWDKTISQCSVLSCNVLKVSSEKFQIRFVI